MFLLNVIHPLLLMSVVNEVTGVAGAGGGIDGRLPSNETRLSRRKRYIVFPEGSSFQLVYCLTMPTYGVGSIFTMGLTAALAWQLPSEPIHLNDKDKEKDKDDDKDKENEKDKENADADKEKQADKRIDTITKQNYYTNFKYKPYYNQNYRPTYIYESEKDPHSNSVHFIPIDHKVSHEYSLPAYRSYQKFYEHRHVHKRTRRDLFEKIEKFFMAQNKDGKSCLLKAVCEVNQRPKGQLGSFVEEIIRAIFTWIPDEESDSEMADIDSASTYKRSCAKKYPQCSHSVFSVFF